MSSRDNDGDQSGVATLLMKAEAKIPPEGDKAGLLVTSESGAQGAMMLDLEGANKLLQAVLSVCLALEERSEESPDNIAKGVRFRADRLHITRGTRPDEANLVVQCGEGRLSILMDLDALVQDLASFVRKIKKDPIGPAGRKWRARGVSASRRTSSPLRAPRGLIQVWLMVTDTVEVQHRRRNAGSLVEAGILASQRRAPRVFWRCEVLRDQKRLR